MPELPEVETTLRGIAPLVLGRRIVALQLRQPALRWPVPTALTALLPGQTIQRGHRRGKYLLLTLNSGHLLLHLGMSGSLRSMAADAAPAAHDHFDLVLDNGTALRFTDPRRFGALLWVTGDPELHPLLRDLGPEPLSDAFHPDYLHQRACGRRIPIKSLLMDSRVVVGIGNIYANEILYLSGVHPLRAAGRIALPRYRVMVDHAKAVLEKAIAQGGTTLRNFVGGDGKPGYFRQQLNVYGRGGEPCPRLRSAATRSAPRAAHYGLLPRCQR